MLNWKKIFKNLMPVSIVLRILLPFLIFKLPLFTVIIVFTLDMIDSTFFRQAGFNRKKYQLVDKTLDFYWYTFILIFALQNFTVGFFLALLFTLRLVGQVLFYLTASEKFFIYFPNYFENVFIFFLLVYLYPGLEYLSGGNIYYLILGAIFVFQTSRELIAHGWDKYYYPYIPDAFKGPE